MALMTGLGLLMGLVAACVAKLLLVVLGAITSLAYSGSLKAHLVAPNPAHWGWPSVFVPVIGALLVGLIARYGSDKIRGHGIPEAIQAILERNSIVQGRVAFYKPLASAITIGTGGPFGAEGPIIMTGGALGSLAAQFLSLSSMERRTLLVCGAAGGMSATFGAPIAAVLIGIELLLFEWRPRSFIPVTAASFAAYALRTVIIGQTPPFAMVHPPSVHVSAYGWAIAIGVAGGFVSAILTKLVYAAEDLYERLPVHWMWWPAIGALLVGIGGLFVPQALGVGYGTINGLLNAQLAYGVVVGVILVKTVIWIAALSSGTSGGVLAPLLMIGAGVGTLFAPLIPGHEAGVWAAVGMAAVIGGTMRAPFMATIFTIETTHAWGLLPPVFIGCVAATAITVLFVSRSILTEKLARRGTHVFREYSVHPLELLAVSSVMKPRDTVETFAPETAFEDAAGTSQTDLALADEDGGLQGFVGCEQIAQHLQRPELRTLSLVSCARPVHTIDADARVRSAASVMAEHGERILAVTGEHGKWIGVVTTDELLGAWRGGVTAETRRERVRSPRFWIKR